MLLIGGKRDNGHILHVIVGPETELYMDVHGAKTLDITPLLTAMNGSSKISLQLTRCRSETATSQTMRMADIPHMDSFVKTEVPAVDKAATSMGTGFPDIDALLKGTTTPTKVKPVPVAVKKAKKPADIGTCTYCNKADVELMDIPGFKICRYCVQIELGRNKVHDDAKK